MISRCVCDEDENREDGRRESGLPAMRHMIRSVVEGVLAAEIAWPVVDSTLAIQCGSKFRFPFLTSGAVRYGTGRDGDE